MAYLTRLQRKFVASTFVAALAVSAVVPVSASSYSDVSDRYKEAVNYLEVQKITQGLTAKSFGTGNSIKRADAAILLAKAMQLDIEQAPESKFTDVPDRAKKYVDALKANGIINGKTIESFASNQLITRGEAALMLAKA
ncbi:S-layer homology domain-containing protein [Planococcus halocryophilus]|uniref:S-layer homology domain-containing protein n=1 Tax=Planococcus halocryophilus TaxID=1215089 RepID=UPI001F100E7E|nr:S-layer homology domain-containing protein [Planococcus halocryophilus]MCH4826822.1 S-layer homology domain-containing protein [Planococcus halocryophilus]